MFGSALYHCFSLCVCVYIHTSTQILHFFYIYIKRHIYSLTYTCVCVYIYISTCNNLGERSFCSDLSDTVLLNPLKIKRGGGCRPLLFPSWARGNSLYRFFKGAYFVCPDVQEIQFQCQCSFHQNSSIFFCRYFNIESIPCAEPQIFFKTSHSFSFACSKSTFMILRTKALDSSST